MNISPEHVRDIHAIAELLIATLVAQVARKGITEGNVAIDAVINCLCYTMKQCDPPLDDEELLRRVKKYFEAMDFAGSPGLPGRTLS